MAELKFLKGLYTTFTGLTGQSFDNFYVTTGSTDKEYRLYLGNKLLARCGSLEEAKRYADGLNTAMNERVAAIEASIGTGNVSTKLTELEKKLSEEISRSTIEDKEHTTAIDTLNDGDTVEGSVANKVKVAVETEATARTGADRNLQNQINTITGSEEGSISKAVADEATARTKADNTLQVLIDKINGEIGTDGSIKDAVSKEATERTEADALLEGKINGIKIVTATTSDTNVKEAYKLVDKDGNLLGTEIKIYKDSSFLGAELGKSGASIDEETGVVIQGEGEDALLLKYINADGKYSLAVIPVGDFLRQSEFKNGLNVVGGEVSVKLTKSTKEKVNTKTEKNFIEFVTEGSENKSLRVGGMDSDSVTTTENIKVAGGPLAKLVKDAGISEIAAGTDIQSLLTQLLCKEEYPANPTYTEASIESTFDNPKVTCNDNGKEVEVGSKITIESINGYLPQHKETPRKYSGFEYGYSESLSGVVETGNPNSVPVSDIALNSGDFTLNCSIEGFGGKTTGSTSTNSTASSCSIPKQNLTVSEGTNKLTYTINGPGHKGNVVASPKYYAASNIGKTSEAHIVNEVVSGSVSDSIATEGKTVITITGSRYFFYSSNKTPIEYNSVSIRNMNKIFKSGLDSVNPYDETKVKKSFILNVNQGDKYVYICLPTTESLKLVNDKKAFGTNISDKFENRGVVTVEGANGEKGIEYNVFAYISGTELNENTYYVTLN